MRSKTASLDPKGFAVVLSLILVLAFVATGAFSESKLFNPTPLISTSDQLREALDLNLTSFLLAPKVYELRSTLRVTRSVQLLGQVSQDGSTPVFDCCGSDIVALELLEGGFNIANITFRNCGGYAPIVIDLRGSSKRYRGVIADCVFRDNSGYMAGAVAVYNDSRNIVDLTMRGCTFINGTAKERKGDYVNDYDYSTGYVQRRVAGASSVYLGRGTYHISGCNFTSNAPVRTLLGIKDSQISAPLVLTCFEGPAQLVVEDSFFQSNSGRQSGGIYFQGHPDHFTPSTACSLTLHRTLIRNSSGYQSGAILASCVVKGSMCDLNLQDSQFLSNAANMSGVIMAREYGMSVTAENVIMADNIGGAYCSVQVASFFKNSWFINNTGPTFAAMDVWGGSFQAYNTVFINNEPFIVDWFKSAAVRMSNSYGGKLINCTFENNTLHALFVYSAAVEITNCSFRKNRAIVGSVFPYGAALMLYGSSYTTSINNTVFEDNVALSGGAVMLSSAQQAVFDSCVFRGNRALSGGALGVDIPVVKVEVLNSLFVNNTAVGSSQSLLGEGGIAEKPRASWGDYGTADNSSAGSGAEGSNVENQDYGVGRGGSGDGAAASGGMDMLAPVESCGSGGGGAVCVRGASDAPVIFKDVVFQGNKALMGGGVYATTGARCQQLVGCYRLDLGPNVTFTDNYASLSGGAVFWLYEKIVRTYCAIRDLSLAPPAWPGLLEKLQSHNVITATSQAVIIARSTNRTSRVAADDSDPVQQTPSSALASPRGERDGDVNSSTGSAPWTYLRRVTPCASWSGNVVGQGGYGPHIATSAFFHLPIMSVAGAVTTGSREPHDGPPPVTMPPASAATLPSGAPAPSRRLHWQRLPGRRRHLLRSASENAAVELPLAPQLPPPSLERLAVALTVQMFTSGDYIPVAVHIFDYYGQRVTRSMVDSPSSVLVTCTSLNALGQKAAEAVNGIANFTQLRVRDQVNATYSLAFTARTAIRDMGEVSLNVTIRACRINEELQGTGDACSPCIEGFYAISGKGGTGSTDGSHLICNNCPEGATCSSRHLGGLIVPQDGYWHSSPWSDNIMKCQNEDACTFDKRMAHLAEFQQIYMEGGGTRREGGPEDISSASATYRRMQCGLGYQGNLCASCAEGYGRSSPYCCSRCHGRAVRIGYGLLAFGLTFLSIAATVRAALEPNFLIETHDVDGRARSVPDLSFSMGGLKSAGSRRRTMPYVRAGSAAAGTAATISTLPRISSHESGSVLDDKTSECQDPDPDIAGSRGANDQTANGGTGASFGICNNGCIPASLSAETLAAPMAPLGDGDGAKTHAAIAVCAGNDGADGGGDEPWGRASGENTELAGLGLTRRLHTLRQTTSEQDPGATNVIDRAHLSSQSSTTTTRQKQGMWMRPPRPSQMLSETGGKQLVQQPSSGTGEHWSDVKQDLGRAAGNTGGDTAAVDGGTSAGEASRPPPLGMLPLHRKMSFASLLIAVRQRHESLQHVSGIKGADTNLSPQEVDLQDWQQQQQQQQRQRRQGASRRGDNQVLGMSETLQERPSHAIPKNSEGVMPGPEPGQNAESHSLTTGCPSSFDQTSNAPCTQQQQQLLLQTPTQGMGAGVCSGFGLDMVSGRPSPSTVSLRSSLPQMCSDEGQGVKAALGGAPGSPPSILRCTTAVTTTTTTAAAATASGVQRFSIPVPRVVNGPGSFGALGRVGSLNLREDTLMVVQESDMDWCLRHEGNLGDERNNDTKAGLFWRRSKRTGFFARRSWRKRTDVISEHATVIKILVSYLQVVSLVKNTPVTWPRVLVNYFNVVAQASSAASSLGSLDCSMRSNALPKSVQAIIVGVLSPVYWSLVLCLFWLLRTVWLRRFGNLTGPRDVLSYLRTRCIITINCIIFIQYPSVVSQLFSLFSCMQVDEGPQTPVCIEAWNESTCTLDKLSIGLYWTQDMEERCYQGVHLRLCLIVGVPGVLLFAAGMPLLSAWWLHRNRRRLRDEHFAALYGTLYQEYEDGYHYWESIVMLRKFTITGVIVFAGTYRWQLTLLLSLGVIALALMAQVAHRPYASDTMDELERLGLVTTLVTFYLATYFMSNTVGVSVRVGLSFAILVLNAVTIFILCMAILRELYRAAIYKLLRISSARGDLPLTFVLRIGFLYLGWRVRVFWTRFRVWLNHIAPLCLPLDFPPVSNGVDGSTSDGGAAPTLMRQMPDAGLEGRRRVAESAAALQEAWDQYHHHEWIKRVVEFSEKILTVGSGGTGTAAEEGPRWRRLHCHVVHGVRVAARSVNVLFISPLSTRLSGSRLWSGRSSSSWLSSLASDGGGGGGSAAPRNVRGHANAMSHQQQLPNHVSGDCAHSGHSTSRGWTAVLPPATSLHCRWLRKRGAPPASVGAAGAGAGAGASGTAFIASAAAVRGVNGDPTFPGQHTGTVDAGATHSSTHRPADPHVITHLACASTAGNRDSLELAFPTALDGEGDDRRSDARICDGSRAVHANAPAAAWRGANGSRHSTSAQNREARNSPMPSSSSGGVLPALGMLPSPFSRANVLLDSGSEGRRKGPGGHMTVELNDEAFPRSHCIQKDPAKDPMSQPRGSTAAAQEGHGLGDDKSDGDSAMGATVARASSVGPSMGDLAAAGPVFPSLEMSSRPIAPAGSVGVTRSIRGGDMRPHAVTAATHCPTAASQGINCMDDEAVGEIKVADASSAGGVGKHGGGGRCLSGRGADGEGGEGNDGGRRGSALFGLRFMLVGGWQQQRQRRRCTEEAIRDADRAVEAGTTHGREDGIWEDAGVSSSDVGAAPGAAAGETSPEVCVELSLSER